MARKLSQKIEGREVILGTRQSRNHASLSPCAFGVAGESGLPGQTNRGSTANLNSMFVKCAGGEVAVDFLNSDFVLLQIEWAHICEEFV
jgi:hypothetical protein